MATHSDVLLFVPNLIGYGRIVCTIASFLVMIGFPKRWLLAVILYLASFVGDLFDGVMARRLNQCSTFGGVLDMITDRCSTLGLFFILAGEYTAEDATLPFPLFRTAFLFLAVLDISSHWVQTYSASSSGHHHKSDQGNEGRSILVRWYYHYYYFFGYLCCGAEFTYISLYARRHLHMEETTGSSFSSWQQRALPTALDIFLAICLPGCIAKQVINIAQLSSGFVAIARYDADQINNPSHNKKS